MAGGSEPIPLERSGTAANRRPLPVGRVEPRGPGERLDLIRVARGQRPADLVVKGARIYNPYLGEFQKGDLAVAAGRVAGIGRYDGYEEIDAGGRMLISGLIDSHVHLESSMTGPAELARALCATGTAAVVADPHEIANVAGLPGLRWLLAESASLPVDVFIMAPSCVPATGLERGGAVLGPADVAELVGLDRVLGLAEVMNFPGLLAGDPEVLAKLDLAALADGHCPGLAGPDLAAYVGAGIQTDHECVAPAEAVERLALGQRVLLREGTAARNLLDLLPALTPRLSRFCHLCTDDRHAGDLIREGSINRLVAMAVRHGGLDFASILNMATLNPARHYGLGDLGSLTPGKFADMALYQDFETFRPDLVWKRGRLVAEGGRPLWARSTPPDPALAGALRGTVKLGPLTLESLAIKAAGPKVRVIGVRPGQIVTDHLILDLEPKDGRHVADPASGIAKLAVWERYGSMAPPAVGLIRGLGLRRGAIGSTVSHDSHNLVVAGASDRDMLACAEALAGMGGGLAVCLDGQVLGSLALPLGGLMSDLSLEETARAIDGLAAKTAGLGLPEGADPFMTLSFMCLPVIPSLKLTAGGLVDVDRFEVVDLAAGA